MAWAGVAEVGASFYDALQGRRHSQPSPLEIQLQRELYDSRVGARSRNPPEVGIWSD